jgi:hypothetical protein
MGKMKEVFMKVHYPHGDEDIEREWLRDDSLKRDQEYEEYLKLISEGILNIDHAKIEVDDRRQTRIEVSSEKQDSHTEAARK